MTSQGSHGKHVFLVKNVNITVNIRLLKIILKMEKHQNNIIDCHKAMTTCRQVWVGTPKFPIQSITNLIIKIGICRYIVKNGL